MSQLAVGIIEVIGLCSAIELADVCVKSANVTLIGYELSQGNGMVVVKIEGNVGAVSAAIQASSNLAKIYSKKVIPRPGDGIECLIKNKNTVGYEDIDKSTDDDTNEKYTCNLCKDPKCPREKGDLRINCIHYDEKDTNS